MERPILPEIVETPRLVLRPFRLGDAEEVFAYAQDPEWSRYLRLLPRPYERHHADEFVARQLLQDRAKEPTWAMTLEGTVVGGIGLTFDFQNRSAEMGYSLARSLWGQGVCTEAAQPLIDAAFSVHGELQRIWARADVQNAASQRVMEKLGMTKEGVHRRARFEGGEMVDEAWWAVLREEWEASQAG